jgi:hypothetical protein
MSQLVVGMAVTNVSGIPASTTITAIDAGAASATMSANATAASSGSVTFKLAASTNYDIWAVASGSTFKMQWALAGDSYVGAWSSSTARAKAVSLSARGAWTRSGDTTSLLIGSIRTISTAGQSTDSEGIRYLSNVYNRAPKKMVIFDVSGHTNTVAAWVGWRSGTYQVVWMHAINDQVILFMNSGYQVTTSANGYIGFGDTPGNPADSVQSEGGLAIVRKSQLLLTPQADANFNSIKLSLGQNVYSLSEYGGTGWTGYTAYAFGIGLF